MTIEVGRGGASPRLNEEGVRKCVLLSRVTFQKVLLIRICTVNVQDKMGAEKYLGESCYHCIKYSVTKSLASLIRKWYLNSAFQLYSYPQRLQEGADGTSINISNLTSTWRVEMRGEMWYKIGGRSSEKGVEKN